MTESTDQRLRFLVLGTAPSGDGLAVRDLRTEATWHLARTSAGGALGPLHTEHGVWFAAPHAASCSAWELATWLPDGLPEGEAAAVVAGVLMAAGTDGPTRVDPEGVEVFEDGRVVVTGLGAPAAGLGALARYLCRGEVAHEPSDDDPAWVSALSAAKDPAAAWRALAAAAPDAPALARRVTEVAGQAVRPEGPLAGRILVVQPGPTYDEAPPRGALEGPTPKVRTARIAALTLGLGLLAGMILVPSRADHGVAFVRLDGQSDARLTCGERVAIVPATVEVIPLAVPWCSVQLRHDDAWRMAPLDMRAGRLYDCRVLRGEVECDET